MDDDDKEKNRNTHERGNVLQFPGDRLPKTSHGAFLDAFERLEKQPNNPESTAAFAEAGSMLLQKMQHEYQSISDMDAALSVESKKRILEEIEANIRQLRTFYKDVMEKIGSPNTEKLQESPARVFPFRHSEDVPFQHQSDEERSIAKELADAEAVLGRNKIYSPEMLKEIVQSMVVPRLAESVSADELAEDISENVLEMYPPMYGSGKSGDVNQAARGRIRQYLCAAIRQLRSANVPENRSPAEERVPLSGGEKLSGTYVVQPNDTLWGILEKHGVPEGVIEDFIHSVTEDEEAIRSIGIASGRAGILQPGETIDLNAVQALLDRDVT